MRYLLQRWLILAAAVAIVVLVLPGIDVDWSPGSYLVVAAVYGIVNALLGTILRLLALPLMLVTLGLFAVVINVVMLYVTSWLTSLSIDGFGSALLASILISVLTVVLEIPVARRARERHA